MIMSVWKYVGGFFLFRWLFGPRERSDAGRNVAGNHGYSQSYDDFLDEQEEYDMMDDEF